VVVITQEPCFGLSGQALSAPPSVHEPFLKTSEGIFEYGEHQGGLGTLWAFARRRGKKLF
jgi:hypothetical protein